MIYDKETIPVCEQCKTIDSKLKTCVRCGIEYCEHFSSEIDIRFCGNCMIDFKVTNSIEIRTTEKKALDGSVIYSKRIACKRLHLEGTDWLFSAAKISTLSDEDLDTTIEYHRAIASMMLHEREERRIEKWRQLNQQVVDLKKDRSNIDGTGAIKGSRLTDAQKAEREADKAAKVAARKANGTGAKAPLDANAIAAAVALLLKTGMDPVKIAELMKGKV